MSGFIPREFIDRVIDQSTIIEIISARVPLKKKGANYMACCPFHSEKTPSFSVNESKQLYYCFGCGAGGNVVRFLRDYDHLEFSEAIEVLAEHLGLQVPHIGKSYANQPNRRVRADIYALLQQAADQYHQLLLKQPRDSEIIAYIKQRGLSATIIDTFQIGYAPPGWDFIKNYLHQQHADADSIAQTGLVSQNDRGHDYDRFRDRLLFPIRDKRGRVIGFGGRIIRTDSDAAKYINSPETPVFQKGRELYGLYELLQSTRQIEKILVVEGYMDVVSLAQQGITYATATLGTATTEEHIKRLFQTCHQIIFCFDGDNAGKKAAWKALETLLPLIQASWQPRFMFLQQGEDPDSFIRTHGKDAFENEMAQAQTLIDFFFSHLASQIDMRKSDANHLLIDLAKPYMQKLPPDSSLGVSLRKQLSRITAISSDELNKLFTPDTARAQTRKVYPLYQTSTRMRTSAWKAIAYLLHYPQLALIAKNSEYYLDTPIDGINVFIRLLDLFQLNPKFSPARLVSLWKEPQERQKIEEIVLTPLLITDFQAIKKEFSSMLNLFYTQQQNQRFQYLQMIMDTSGLRGQEQKEYVKLLQRKS